ncbi:hypothetical protein E4U58_001059 [Claviceps cyperi]|nr:hypothetical protein E4U58_001059 [Claviceps cyperi]
MHFLAPLLSVGGLTLASALVAPHDARPATSLSQGFNLVVNVTDLNRDFSPSVHGKFLDSIHIGAGDSLLSTSDDKKSARIFYVNGSAAEFHFGLTTVVSDSATPPAPFSISLAQNNISKIERTVHLSSSAGNKGVGITHLPVPYSFLSPETYAICNESLSYYRGARFLIVKQFQLGLQTLKSIPANCVPVRLLPECTKLNDLPKDSYSSHEFTYGTSCYDRVADIDWTKYPSW